ncbi:MAG: glycerophosphodiester phosphodiesterase family protein [Pseudomonadota bacterium]
MTLPEGFFACPFAHRALHGPGRPENSREAILAAVEAGYGIEIDVQLSFDHQAMVFHDYGTRRLTGAGGTVQTRSAKELSALPLLGGPTGAPTLPEALALVAGRTPLLIEIKDQDGAMGPNVGTLEAAVAEALTTYEGPVALMSFNPHAVAALKALAPSVPRGLTTCAFTAEDWPTVPATRRAELVEVPDYRAVGADFISHDRHDLTSPHVARLKASGASVCCWTIRSPEEEAEARRVADQITFESYPAALDA